LERLISKCLLRIGDVKPSRPDYEVIGVFNPGAVRWNGQVVILARVAERPIEQRDDAFASPKFIEGQGIVNEWLPKSEWELRDPRIVIHKQDDTVRLTFISHLRVFTTPDGVNDLTDTGIMLDAANEYDAFGTEDPRITPIGDTCYITYVSPSMYGVVTCLAKTTDFKTFERLGVIFCPENKDIMLFPDKINGQYMAIHRPNGASQFCNPEMWLASSPDLIHWGDHQRLTGGAGGWEGERIGGGTPCIRTEKGWLHFYHGKRTAIGGELVGAYCGGAMLLDLNDPRKILARSQDPLLEPVEDFETQGFVPNVVFPTGIVEQDDTLLLYCGAADENLSVVGLSKQAVLDSLG